MLIAALLLNSFVPTLAEDDDDEHDGTPEEPIVGDDEPVVPNQPVSAVAIFPEYFEQTFPAGAVVESLVGFKNQNENTFHVEYIRGMVVNPFDPTHYVQNFSGSMYNTTVDSGDEACLVYRFSADPSINPSEYILVMELYYSDDANQTFLTTIYNGTVVITDPETQVDAKTVFAYISILGFFGGLGYLGFTSLNKNKKKSSAPKKEEIAQQKEAEKSAGIDWDFISADHAKLFKKAGTSPTRKGTSSPSRKGRRAD